MKASQILKGIFFYAWKKKERLEIQLDEDYIKDLELEHSFWTLAMKLAVNAEALDALSTPEKVGGILSKHSGRKVSKYLHGRLKISIG